MRSDVSLVIVELANRKLLAAPLCSFFAGGRDISGPFLLCYSGERTESLMQTTTNIL